MDEKVIIAKSLEWEQYIKFVTEVESKRPIPTAKNKDDVSGITKDRQALNTYNVQAAVWIIDNVYPDLNKKDYTPAELMALYFKTISLSTVARDDELKNLIGFSTGSVIQQDKNTAEPAQKDEKPEKQEK